MGYLYRRKLRNGQLGRIWWVKYYVNGRHVRESTGADKESEARRFEKEREGRAATGQPILPRADRVRYEEVAQDLRQHYQSTASRNPDEAESRFNHLDPFFRGCRIAGITQATITAYALKRQGEGASNATINREVAVTDPDAEARLRGRQTLPPAHPPEAQRERAPSGLL